ncbi:MAG: ABC transporter substrate-binding protein [Chloroflexales bacterium]|nr:ABC transporter substrate-binding protein [Chloroflexales bacterium]
MSVMAIVAMVQIFLGGWQAPALSLGEVARREAARRKATAPSVRSLTDADIGPVPARIIGPPVTDVVDPATVGDGKAAAGEPIVVGGIVGATGPDNWSSGAKSATAYFKCLNANGGINGRPVNYLVEDDKWNPEQAALVAAKLVKDDKVVAMVGNTSFVECGVNRPLYEQEDLMVIAAVGVPRECFEQKNYVPTNAGPRVSTLGAAQYAFQKYGAKRQVCIATNVPNAGTWTCEGIEAWGKGAGVEVKSIYIDPGALDATSVVLEAAAWKPDALLTSIPGGVAVPIFKAGQDQDLRDKFHWLGPTSIYDLKFPEAIGDYWDGYVDAQIELNATDSSGPDNTAWRTIMDTYGDPSDPRDTFSQAGYLAAKIFSETLLKLDPAKIDRQSVTAALRQVKQYKSDLMCGEWYVSPGDRQNANHAGRMASIKGGKWVTVADCFETQDVDLKPILELEAKEGLVSK